MSSHYTVLIQPPAEADIAGAYQYLRLHAPQHAASWYDGLAEAILSLEQMPQRCALAPEDEAFEEPIRHLLYHSYRVLFTVMGDEVRILHVRHGARKPLTP